MLIAELHPASVWDCDYCGRENFIRAIRIDKSQIMHFVPEDRIDEVEHVEGEWLMTPDVVQCVDCGKTYKTRDD